jgi:hypothetical protein
MTIAREEVMLNVRNCGSYPASLLLILALVVPAGASSRRGKGEVVIHAASTACIRKRLDRDQKTCLLRRLGRRRFHNGETPSYKMHYQLVVLMDSTAAVIAGGDSGYKTFTAADGGQVLARYHGTEAAPPVYKGKWEFIGGTGKYAGIKGQGTYIYHSVTETTGWDVLEGEYELP